MSIERLSASVASRHIACHASANLEVAIPNWVPPVEDPDVDNAANRGTIMHELFAGMQHLKTADAEHMVAALQYVNNVRRLRRFKSMVEQTVTIQWLVSKPKTTADLVLYVADELHIIDLKTGKIPVSAVDNSQLKYYALAYEDLAPRANGAWLHIVQPWADNIETWFASTQVLTSFKDSLIQTEQRIHGGSIAFAVGDHCMFCPANPHGRGDKGKPYCPVMMEFLYPDPTNYDEILRGD